jgi:FkbM family methyltransferase
VRNPIYHAAELRRYAQAIGWQAAVRLRCFDLKARAGLGDRSSLRLRPKNSEFPIEMRAHTSDREVLGQVFIQREYEAAKLSQPKMILDLGANVGYSSAYFLSRYPTASVLAVEPDPGNYAACCRNLAPFGRRARTIQGAAWVECTRLLLDKGTYRDGRDWATQVRRPTQASESLADVDAYDVPTLIGLCHTPEIDLLKIDIERSELELFSRKTEDWLPRVRNLCIELHGPECEAVFFRALLGYFYNLNHSGELTVCSDLRPRS